MMGKEQCVCIRSRSGNVDWGLGNGELRNWEGSDGHSIPS